MLKALIVDDDKLVRKGLISIMPWNTYGIKVVGDVCSGEKALEFLAENEVSLLVTDIVMPVMTGMELVKIVKERYPGIWIVLLTFYQNFEYIQEALRLGAIDYIIKTHLEKEQMSDILDRIVTRIKSEESFRQSAPTLNETKKHDISTANCRKGYAFLSASAEFNTDLLHSFPWFSDCSMVEIAKNFWFLQVGKETESGIEDGLITLLKDPGGIIIEISKTDAYDSNTLHKLLREYTDQVLLYDYNPDQRIYRLSMDEVANRKPEVSFDTVQELIREWSAFQWINNDEIYRRQLERIQKLQPPVSKLESIFYSAIAEMKKYSEFIDEPYTFPPVEGCIFWRDWLCWIDEVRSLIQKRTRKPFYSKEVVQSIMKALDYINQAAEEDIKQENLAREVNISRGYFSVSFRDIVGKPFNEYIRDVRIERAKHLLVMTDKPVYWIAEKLGYKSEKYFSRIFKGKCTMLPTEYRSKNAQYKKC